MPDEIAIGQQQARNQQDQKGQPAREMIHLRHQRCRQLRDPFQQATDAPDLGRLSGRYDQTARRALGDQRARPKHRPPIPQRCINCHLTRRFLDRHGLPGQDRLLRRKTARLQHPQIRRHLVTRLQQNHVTGHQIGTVQRDPHPIAQDGGAWGQHAADRGHGGLGLALLQVADHGIGQHHRQDHARVDPVLQRSRHDGSPQQHINQHIVELRQKPHQRPMRVNLGQTVRPMRGQSPRRLSRAQPRRVRVQRRKAGIDRLAVRIGQQHRSPFSGRYTRHQ